MHHLTAVDMKPQRELDWTVNCVHLPALLYEICVMLDCTCVLTAGVIVQRKPVELTLFLLCIM